MILSVAVNLLSGNLKSGANSGAKSARDLCSTLKERGETNLYRRAVAGSASSVFGRNYECNDKCNYECNYEDSDSVADVATETVIMVGPYSGVTIRAVM